MKKGAVSVAFILITSMVSARCRVAIDIGHDPKHSGAISSTGIAEYKFNRRVALMTYRYLLQKGVDAFFINSEEKPISLLERSSRAIEYGGDLFVSFHHDSVQPKFLNTWTAPNGSTQKYCDRFSGYTIFVSRKNAYFKKSLQLANEIGTKMKDASLSPCSYHGMNIKHENRSLLDKGGNVYAFDNLVVLKNTVLPAVLIELGMIVNRHEESILWNEERLRVEADAISNGILMFCKKEGGRWLQK